GSGPQCEILLTYGCSCSLGIHPEYLPMMTVEVVKAPTVHEAVVHGGHGVLAAGGNSLFDRLVHGGPILARDREQSFRLRARIADLLLRERFEKGLREEHYVSILVDHHAGGLLIGELWVELKTELGEKLLRTVQITNSDIDKNLAGHGNSPS